jgi:glycerol uptake facilitator-like aquaporin/protein-tyrosine-phosphatase
VTAHTPHRPYNVLFLCTGNSARSIMAEAILSRFGAGKFNAYSAGSMPKGAVHPEALKLLQRMNYKTDAFRSKSWDEFTQPGAPQLDFVFTVCDNAAGEVCPVWPGQPMTAHWGVPDPPAVEGSAIEVAQAFADAYGRLNNRIAIFVNLPFDGLDRLSLQRRLDDIGKSKDASRVAAEFGGALVLTAVVIGSGVMGVRMADGNAAIALLANTLATAAILFVLITALAPVSGAHFNPAVTLVFALKRELAWGDALAFVLAQIAGCVAGVVLAHVMFELPLLQTATNVREGPSQWLSEGAATFALVACILLVSRARPNAVAAAVALTIAAGYWWTASTSFANPAITIARALSDTFAGIRPEDAPAFIVAQLIGALAALTACGWLYPPARAGASS